MSIGDLGILLAYMAGLVALGLWMGRGAHDVAEYAVGSRDLPWWLILFSIIATETSSVTFLSIPGFAYERDLTWLQIALGFVVGRFAVSALLLPHYFRGALYSMRSSTAVSAAPQGLRPLRLWSGRRLDDRRRDGGAPASASSRP